MYIYTPDVNQIGIIICVYVIIRKNMMKKCWGNRENNPPTLPGPQAKHPETPEYSPLCAPALHLMGGIQSKRRSWSAIHTGARHKSRELKVIGSPT